MDKVAGKRPTWLPKAAAQADMIIGILYIHNMLSRWMWMDCE
jgi:hypothetical protein